MSSSSRELRHSLKETLRVLVLDLWCYIPYYDKYFCESLREVGVDACLAATSYYLDPTYFQRQKIRNRPGLLDLVAKLRLRHQTVRRILMLIECCLNMLALTIHLVVDPPEILHVQWIPLAKKFPFDLWFMKFAKSRGVKVAYTVHNILPHDTGQRFKDTYRRVYRQADALICHTGEAKDRLLREFALDPSRIWVIPHGPLFHNVTLLSIEESRARLGLCKDTSIVLMQGMLKPYKGVGFLLEAWREVRSLEPAVQLVIAGPAEKEYEADIRAKVSALGLQDSVRLELRFIADEELSLYYRAADIIVYPYQSITTSGALMTGLVYDRPIVATDLPAFREVLEGHRNSTFVKYGDATALSATLIRLIRNPPERVPLSAGDLQRRCQDSWAAIALRTRDCYMTLLGRELSVKGLQSGTAEQVRIAAETSA